MIARRVSSGDGVVMGLMNEYALKAMSATDANAGDVRMCSTARLLFSA
jgi:hypothetical protein